MAFVDPIDTPQNEAQRTLEQVADNSHEGIVIIGTGQKIDYVNERVSQILGRPRGEILGQGFLSFVYKEDSDLVLDRYCKRLDGIPIESDFEMRVLNAQNGPRNVHVRTSVLRDCEDGSKYSPRSWI